MRSIFDVVLIKPTHYHDDGYPLQWIRSNIPSNSLATLYGLISDCAERRVLGPEVEIRIQAIDETNQRVRPDKILRRIRRNGGRGYIGLVGVQSNQYPRALDLARAFRAGGLPVGIGGFHVSGVLAMLKEPTPELREAIDLGVSLFAGEAEDGRLDEVLRDAFAGTPKPIYNYIDKLPPLESQPLPFLPQDSVKRTLGIFGSFDLGRGCPFQCSFCTIINVQGRVSRFRSADDLEAIVRANAAIGVDRFFLTDDNLARNRNWEACFDRLIELREKEGLYVRLSIQVDTLCHRIPNFIEKAFRAGADYIFVGMENINPDNLAAAKKKQNRITEYRDMLLAWKRFSVVIVAGYIIGFPNDTKASILHDVEIIKRELPLDMIYFTNLTPLPGCEDHKRLLAEGAWMDPDLNLYDLNHRVTHHERMSDAEWDEAYREVWKVFYTKEHLRTILLRRMALGNARMLTTVNRLLMYREYRLQFGVHPLEGGFVRRVYRRDRRPGLPRESILGFYPRLLWETARANVSSLMTYAYLRRQRRLIMKDPKSLAYRDAAITPSAEADLDHLDLYVDTRGGSDAVRKLRHDQARRAAKMPASAPETTVTAAE